MQVFVKPSMVAVALSMPKGGRCFRVKGRQTIYRTFKATIRDKILKCKTCTLSRTLKEKSRLLLGRSLPQLAPCASVLNNVEHIPTISIEDDTDQKKSLFPNDASEATTEFIEKGSLIRSSNRSLPKLKRFRGCTNLNLKRSSVHFSWE